MKKIVSLILCAILSVGLIGCSSSTDVDSNIKEEQVNADTTKEKEDNTENNEKTDKEEYDSNIYEATVICPKCGKNAGATEDGKIICKYCGYEGKHETQADKQKKYANKTYQDGYNDGYGVGFDIGIVNGEKNITSYSNDREAYLNEEYENGYSEGWQKGYSEGWNIGYKRYENTPEENEEDQNVKKGNYNHLEEEAKENGTYEEFEEHDDSYYE